MTNNYPIVVNGTSLTSATMFAGTSIGVKKTDGQNTTAGLSTLEQRLSLKAATDLTGISTEAASRPEVGSARIVSNLLALQPANIRKLQPSQTETQDQHMAIVNDQVVLSKSALDQIEFEKAQQKDHTFTHLVQAVKAHLKTNGSSGTTAGKNLAQLASREQEVQDKGTTSGEQSNLGTQNTTDLSTGVATEHASAQSSR